MSSGNLPSTTKVPEPKSAGRGNLPSTKKTEAVTTKSEATLTVPQYGPKWVEHVLAGGALRDGNVLILD